MTTSGRDDFEALLAHVDWVRDLARHVTADAHAADDLAQDAFAAALAHPPADDRPLRKWLAGVVRNLARHGRRSAHRRVGRERAVARAEVQPSHELALERFDSHRLIVEAVARLAEPYRATILMRYFEGLTPAAIAEREGVPLRTVHTRLNRALARLRADLDRAHGGDRDAWLLVLVRFARGSERTSAVALGTIVMNAKLKIAVAAMLVVGLCSTFVLWNGSVSTVPEHVAAAPASAAELAPSNPLEVSAPEIARRAQQAVPTERSATAPIAPAPTQLSGQVMDVDHAPVAGVTLRVFDRERRPQAGFNLRSDAEGRFTFDRPAKDGVLDIATPGWTSVFQPRFTPRTDACELVLVVARSISLHGRVLDERRMPVAGAEVAVPLYGFRARFDAILDTSNTVERGTRTDADGRFELNEVPLISAAKLVTTHAVFLADERELPLHDEAMLEIVLRSAITEPARIVGTVVDADDNPVEGAWVSFGAASTKSAPNGAFTIERSQHASGSELLRAVKERSLPAELAAPWREPIVLRLGGAPLTIDGRVLDADGAPLADALVWTDQEKHFGSIAIENEMTFTAGASLEGIMRGDAWTPHVWTDSKGRFALGGLLPRDYRFHALDQRHLLGASASFAAGVRNAEIRMPKELVYERVAGRVTELGGAPIVGLGIALERTLAGVQHAGSEFFEGETVLTEADGTFVFKHVSRAVTSVVVKGRQVATLVFRHPIGADDDIERLVLAVPLAVHVQVDATGMPDVDEVSLLDARGEQLSLSLRHGDSSYEMDRIRLQAGKSEAFSVSELARTLVLHANGVEAQRLPVSLKRGELNSIRP